MHWIYKQQIHKISPYVLKFSIPCILMLSYAFQLHQPKVLIRNCAFGWYNQKLYANIRLHVTENFKIIPAQREKWLTALRTPNTNYLIPMLRPGSTRSVENSPKPKYVNIKMKGNNQQNITHRQQLRMASSF